MRIAAATTDDEISACFDLMNELRPHLLREAFVAVVRDMERDGYTLAYLEVDGRVHTVAGFRMKRTLFCDSFLYVDDLVTTSTQRSQSYGRIMLDWLKARAQTAGCAALHLDSGLQREDAHRFYRTNGLRTSGYHFRIDFDSRGPWSQVPERPDRGGGRS